MLNLVFGRLGCSVAERDAKGSIGGYVAVWGMLYTVQTATDSVSEEKAMYFFDSKFP